VGIFDARLSDKPRKTLFSCYSHQISIGENNPLAATLSNKPTQVCLKIAVIGIATVGRAFALFCRHGKTLRIKPNMMPHLASIEDF
jgi:hypothetical protein